MGFFKHLKGNQQDAIGGSSSTGNEVGGPSSDNSMQNSSGHETDKFAPPPGPPPSHLSATHYSTTSTSQSDPGQYAPPPGPPPGRNEYAPPQGPPPAQSQPGDAPPPYHDWTVIPDTALLPPPPSLGHETSPINNASLADADRAHEWCARFSLVRPHQPTAEQLASVQRGDIGLLRPREFHGRLDTLRPGTWKGSTQAASSDCCIVTSSPLYFASSDSPWQTEVKKTIYFEVKIRSLGYGRNATESSVALGFCAMPYPTWRLPGWERGSLAVHGDDGRRYVNDTWGGKDFTSAFNAGDTVGLGMTFSVPSTPPEYGALSPNSTTLKVDVFFTRNGRVEGGWDIHEELDASKDLGVEGLDGQFDLYGAIGCFGGVEFECLFNRQDWLWLPR